ncbi:MAG: alpha/beta hydrolase [Pseudomonadota bacterium]
MSSDSLAFWNSQLQSAITVPDYESWPERYRALSQEAARFGAPERIALGEDDMQALWRLPTGRPSHGFIFIHGGYWRAFTAADFAFVAAAAHTADATFYNVDYRLMPGSRMADVVADTTNAVVRAMEDVEHAIIVGHSAGGHLAAEAALRVPQAPAACVAISGLFELAPLVQSFIQEEIALTEEEVTQFSPQDRAAEFRCPVHLVTGGDETVEFKRQSARLYDTIAGLGIRATLHFEPGCTHTAVVAELASEKSALTRRVAALFDPST